MASGMKTRRGQSPFWKTHHTASFIWCCLFKVLYIPFRHQLTLISVTITDDHRWAYQNVLSLFKPWAIFYQGGRQTYGQTLSSYLSVVWLLPVALSFPMSVYVSRWVRITMTSHEHLSFSNHRQLHCLFNRLFKLTSRKTSKFCITSPLWVEPTDDRWIPLTKGHSAENVSFMVCTGVCLCQSVSFSFFLCMSVSAFVLVSVCLLFNGQSIYSW